MIVVDSSVLIATLLPDESGPDLPELMADYDEVLAPWLLWVEIRNVLLSSERRGRLTITVEAALEQIEALGITLDQMPRSTAVMRLARRHRLSAYDALYLELALRFDADLATLDSKLATAAEAEGVRVVS